jgi:hypothetical protein
VRLPFKSRPSAPAAGDVAAGDALTEPASRLQPPRRVSLGASALRILLHVGFLLIAAGCLAAYEHFRAAGQSGVAVASLVAAAGFGFAPVRDVVRVVFGVERGALHLVHVLGGLGLVALPLTGVVSGAPVLTHAALAPLAIMGAAQALMHQDHPRNAAQAAALQRFVASLPEVAQVAGSNSLASPASAERAIAVLTDIVAKAQALGETELESDPGFQSALRQVSTRFGANLGLDAVDLVLAKMAANPSTAAATPALRSQVARARRAIAGRRRRRSS